MSGDFSRHIVAQLDAFIAATDYLVLNLYDYRELNSFGIATRSRNTGVLALNPKYQKILDRSRVVRAQREKELAADGYGWSEGPPLQISVVVPADFVKWTACESGSREQCASLKIKATGGSYAYSASATSKLRQSRIPYTQWTNPAQGLTATADYGWAIFDFKIGNQSMPVGNYALEFVDIDSYATEHWQGTKDISKYTIGVAYVDPNNIYSSSMSPNSHAPYTLLHGFYAFEWPWGQLVIDQQSASQWSTYLTYYGGCGTSDCWTGAIAQFSDYDYNTLRLRENGTFPLPGDTGAMNRVMLDLSLATGCRSA